MGNEFILKVGNLNVRLDHQSIIENLFFQVKREEVPEALVGVRGLPQKHDEASTLCESEYFKD